MIYHKTTIYYFLCVNITSFLEFNSTDQLNDGKNYRRRSPPFELVIYCYILKGFTSLKIFPQEYKFTDCIAQLMIAVEKPNARVDHLTVLLE